MTLVNRHILSTKKLTGEQQLLFSNHIKQSSYDAVYVKIIDDLKCSPCDNVIVTSQNGVRAMLYHKIKAQRVFCVGAKTAALLTFHGYKVIETANNAQELANTLVHKYASFTYLYCCSTIRRDVLPDALMQHAVVFQELKCYETISQSVTFSEPFDAVLFYSPSGVKSYVQSHNTCAAIAFCIGNTTARKAQKHFKNVVISKETAVESVIQEVNQYFQQ